MNEQPVSITPTDLRTEMIRALTRAMLQQINTFDYGEFKERQEEMRGMIVHAAHLMTSTACKDVGLSKEQHLQLSQAYADNAYGKESVS